MINQYGSRWDSNLPYRDFKHLLGDQKRLPADLHKYTKFQETMKTNYDTIIQEIYNLIKLYTEFNEICQK